jgi:HD-GYP domain-containing protein (c-di-GMP phosphodiesterase class II)
MIDLHQDIVRANVKVAVLHDVYSWREFHELTLRHAGYGQVVTYTTDIVVDTHLNISGSKKTDLIIFGIHPESVTNWGNLDRIRKTFDGPVLVTTEHHDPAAKIRSHDLGILDSLGLGEFGEEGLELKVDTALTAHRTNKLLMDNDLRTQRLFVNILTVMVKILESKDPYTRFHSHSVAKWSRMLGRREGLCEEDLDRLAMAACFHDFGKIGIPDEILCKETKLTDLEFDIMKKHPTIARDLLSSLELLSDILPAITHHHERWDGRGYPDGLKGEQTPLWARIIALADSYDTMASRRAYKEPYTPERIKEELNKGRNTQFDSHLVDHFIKILEDQVVAG